MKIILACIVGKEESVIERFIRSFAPAVDGFVFVPAIGTSLPDLSMQKAVIVCEDLKKSIHQTKYDNAIEMEHVDHFGNARQKAWNIASIVAGKDGFTMWADMDDVLAPGAAEAIRAAAAEAKYDVYILPYHVRGDKQVVHRERLIRTSIQSRWKYGIHEQLDFPLGGTYHLLKEGIFLHQPLAEKSGSHERNVRILENELSETPRNLFYLSQEYFQTGQEKKFQKFATAALACPGMGELERYEILLNLAQTPGNDSRKLAAEAFAIMPDRREALALLVNYALIDGDNEKALTLAEIMIGTEKPKRSYWSQNNEWYGWKGAELYRQCLRLNGLDADADLETDIGIDGSRPVFSIIHATLGRPQQALGIREMWLSRARHPENVEYVFGVHSFDEKSVKMLRGFKHSVTDQKGPGWNYDTAAGISTGDIIIQAQDDCYPPDGWDEALLSIIGDTSKPVFVAVNDGHRTDRLSVNTIMTRSYMERKAKRDPGENGFFHRGYATIYPDTENSFRAIQDGLSGECEYIDAPQFLLYHDHPAFNPTVPWDSTYEWENAPENYASGAKLFAERNPEAGTGCLGRHATAAECRDETGCVVARAVTVPLMPEPVREEAFA